MYTVSHNVIERCIIPVQKIVFTVIAKRYNELQQAGLKKIFYNKIFGEAKFYFLISSSNFNQLVWDEILADFEGLDLGEINGLVWIETKYGFVEPDFPFVEYIPKKSLTSNTIIFH